MRETQIEICICRKQENRVGKRIRKADRLPGFFFVEKYNMEERDMEKKERKKWMARIAAGLLAIILIFGILSGAAMAAGFEITETYVGYYKQYHNGELRMRYQAKMHKLNGEMAYCVSMTKTSEPGSAKEVSIKKFLPGEELVMACLAQKHIFDMDGYTRNEKYMLTQCMIWYIQRDHIGDGGWRQYVDEIDMSVEQQKAFFSKLEKQVSEEAPDYTGSGKAYENVDIEDVQEVAVLDAPVQKKGYAKLVKASAAPDITGDNKCYSLAGGVFGVYSDAGCTKKAGELTTKEDGTTEPLELAVGSYYVKELAAPKGFLLDESVKGPYAVKSKKTTAIPFEDRPGNDPVGIELAKIDQETGGYTLQGAASLAGAQFAVRYYDGYYTKEDLPEKPKRTWVIETQEVKSGGESRYLASLTEDCRVSGDAFYKYGEEIVLPLGTIAIEEIKAPSGYLLKGATLQQKGNGERNEGIYVTQIRGDEKKAGLIGGNEFASSDRVIRGDLELVKIEARTHKRMREVPFRITSKTTGESHILVTDENGQASTASDVNPHSEKTNANDEAEDGRLDASAGIWFGLAAHGENVPVNDGLGALPYDTYEIEELPCASNEGHDLIPAFEVAVSREKKTVHLGTLTNEKPEIPEEPEITIHTTAVNKEDGEKTVKAGEEVTIADTVTIEGLTPGKDYLLYGWEMLKSENKELLIDGEMVEDAFEFTAEESDMQIKMEFTFPADALGGADVVTFEELYDLTDPDDPEKVAEHTDIHDEGQTVSVEGEVKIHTTAANKAGGGKTLKPGEQAAIVDTVELEGLTVGKKYRLRGWEMLKDKNAELLIDGKRVEKEYEFTAEEPDMQIEMEFTFSASELGGSKLVTFEELYDLTDPENPEKVTEHKDIDDEGQTVTVKKNEKPKTPEKAKTPKKGRETVKTGDTANLLFWLLLGGASGSALLFNYVRRRKKPEGAGKKESPK